MTPRLRLLLLLSLLPALCLSGFNNKHGGGNRFMELLTAGIVAKVLQKQDDHGGGGGHEYYPVPIPVPSSTHGRHHHVTEKIIPIPIPHHTTRIIHINAGSHHGEGGGGIGGGFDHGGGGGGYDDMGHSHDIGHSIGGGGGGFGGGDHHDDGPHHDHAPTIQQLMFHDGGVYGMPQSHRPAHHPYHPHRPHHLQQHPHHPHGMPMGRPVVGMVVPRHPVYPIPSMNNLRGVLPPIHPAATTTAHQQMVRIRHYYALPSARHRLLAYPQQQHMSPARYQQLLAASSILQQQKRYPRPWK